MIGASPDGLLKHKSYNEKWPGHGIIEIKCLPSQANQKIDLDKVGYLDKDHQTNKHKLKRSHTYWTQIQVLVLEICKLLFRESKILITNSFLP